MKTERVILSIENGVAWVTLSRLDKKNAFDMEMFYQLNRIIDKLLRDKNLRAVVLRSGGEDFSTGLDIKSIIPKPSSVLRLLFKWNPWKANLAQKVCVGWRRIPVPVVCQIKGRCWGAGMQLALGADFRFASMNSEFSIMEAKWGLIPDMGGSLALRELLPVDQAMKITMLAEKISAEKAKELNLITEVADDVEVAVKEFLEKIIAASPDANAGVKKLYHKAWHHNDPFLLFRECYYQIKVLLSPNQRIAVARNTTKPDTPYVHQRFR